MNFAVSDAASDCSLENTGFPPVHNRVPEVSRPDESVGPSVAVDENKPDHGPTSSSAAGLLRGVRDSANAFILLKTVAGGLYFILENCEV